MSEPYFNTDQRRATLLEVCRSWLGTPFVAHGRLKGIGVDCVHIGLLIYQEIGVLGSDLPNFPPYSMDQGLHTRGDPLDDSPVHRFILSHCPGLKPSAPDLNVLPGDLLGFKMGRIVFHTGIVFEKLRFVHAVRGNGVIENDLRDPSWASRHHVTYRPIT